MDHPAPSSPTPPDSAHPELAQRHHRHVGELRELFWQNVIREMLTSLSMLSMKMEAQAGAQKMDPSQVIIDTPEGTITQGATAEADDEAEEQAEEESLFDGRLAVITTLGNRIPIADVHPLFACGVTNNADDRSLATAVECTVFQIRTPPGEVYTLPLSEIRGFHSLSPELVERLQRQAEAQLNHITGGPDEENQQPFGFAAFTSLAQSDRETSTEADNQP